jgi:hypothetical protein
LGSIRTPKISELILRHELLSPPPPSFQPGNLQSDQQETKSRVLPHLLFYRNVFLSLISRFYLLAVNTRFVGCLPLKNLLLIAFINFL